MVRSASPCSCRAVGRQNQIVYQARGGSWNRQDIILYAKYPGEIYRIPASGGVPQRTVERPPSQTWKTFLKLPNDRSNPFGS